MLNTKSCSDEVLSAISRLLVPSEQSIARTTVRVGKYPVHLTVNTTKLSGYCPIIRYYPRSRKSSVLHYSTIYTVSKMAEIMIVVGFATKSINAIML